MSVFKLPRTGKTMKTLLSEMMNGTWASTDVVFKSKLILSTAHLGFRQATDEVFRARNKILNAEFSLEKCILSSTIFAEVWKKACKLIYLSWKSLGGAKQNQAFATPAKSPKTYFLLCFQTRPSCGGDFFIPPRTRPPPNRPPKLSNLVSLP